MIIIIIKGAVEGKVTEVHYRPVDASMKPTGADDAKQPNRCYRAREVGRSFKLIAMKRHYCNGRKYSKNKESHVFTLRLIHNKSSVIPIKDTIYPLCLYIYDYWNIWSGFLLIKYLSQREKERDLARQDKWVREKLTEKRNGLFSYYTVKIGLSKVIAEYTWL